jgi:DNA-binding MarR family transcriptional regulator
MEREDARARQDWADRHVERWRGHWLDVDFDDTVEAISVRLVRLRTFLRRATQEALAEVGLQDFEYETLHALMIRDTPGEASPSTLAADLGVSNAGMTGRLDSLERTGWLRRRTDPQDRRRVHVEVTEAGRDIWRRAMRLRGRAEDELFGVLTAEQRSTLAALLRELTLAIEDTAPDGS